MRISVWRLDRSTPSRRQTARGHQLRAVTFLEALPPTPLRLAAPGQQEDRPQPGRNPRTPALAMIVPPRFWVID